MNVNLTRREVVRTGLMGTIATAVIPSWAQDRDAARSGGGGRVSRSARAAGKALPSALHEGLARSCKGGRVRRIIRRRRTLDLRAGAAVSIHTGQPAIRGVGRAVAKIRHLSARLE